MVSCSYLPLKSLLSYIRNSSILFPSESQIPPCREETLQEKLCFLLLLSMRGGALSLLQGGCVIWACASHMDTIAWPF